MIRSDKEQDLFCKMRDMIELIYLIKKMKDEPCGYDCSKKYLLGMVDDMEDIRYKYNKISDIDIDYDCRCGYDCRREYYRCDKGNNEGFFDRILFFLNSLNDD